MGYAGELILIFRIVEYVWGGACKNRKDFRPPERSYSKWLLVFVLIIVQGLLLKAVRQLNAFGLKAKTKKVNFP
jgi:hypothetical protein